MALAKLLPAGRLDLLKQNLRLLAPPRKPQEMDDDALRALGLFDFVHLQVPSPDATLHRDLLIDFISSFKSKQKQSTVQGNHFSAHKDMFREALGIRCVKRPPLNISPEALSSTATKFVEVYILPVHGRTADPSAGKVGEALRDVNQNLACSVDWAVLIFHVAKKEIVDMVTEKRNIVWDCFYATYWLRLIQAQKEDLFLHTIAVQQVPVGAIHTNEFMEDNGDVVREPAIEKPRKFSELLSICAQASTSVHEGTNTGWIDPQQEQDGRNQSRNGDALGVSVDDVNVNNNFPQHFEGLRTRSTGSPCASIAGEDDTGTGASISPTSSIQHTLLALSEVAHATAQAEGHESSLQRTEEVNNYTIDTAAPKHSKRKVVDGSSVEIITKKRELSISKVTNPREPGMEPRPSSSLQHTEAQLDLDNALCTSPRDDVVILLKIPRTCFDSRDAAKSTAHISRIEQIVEETVRQYVEKLSTVFDSSSLPPLPKDYDQTTFGDVLQLPESASSTENYIFNIIVANLKNLQKLASGEAFDQHVFIKELRTVLNEWELLFALYFTEGIKVLVTKLKVVMKEVDDESRHQKLQQLRMDELSQMNKHADKVIEEAELAHEQLMADSITEIDPVKLARDKGLESINAIKAAYTNNIEVLQKKIAEQMRGLSLAESLEAEYADLCAKEIAASRTITESSSNLEKAIAKAKAVSMEMAKRLQQMEEDQVLPAPVRAVRCLIMSCRIPIDE